MFTMGPNIIPYLRKFVYGLDGTGSTTFNEDASSIIYHKPVQEPQAFGPKQNAPRRQDFFPAKRGITASLPLQESKNFSRRRTLSNQRIGIGHVTGASKCTWSYPNCRSNISRLLTKTSSLDSFLHGSRVGFAIANKVGALATYTPRGINPISSSTSPISTGFVKPRGV